MLHKPVPAPTTISVTPPQNGKVQVVYSVNDHPFARIELRYSALQDHSEFLLGEQKENNS